MIWAPATTKPVTDLGAEAEASIAHSPGPRGFSPYRINPSIGRDPLLAMLPSDFSSIEERPALTLVGLGLLPVRSTPAATVALSRRSTEARIASATAGERARRANRCSAPNHSMVSPMIPDPP